MWKNTLHENIFAYLFPNLERQKVFGLGKGGYKKYGVKKYTADFYDKEDNSIWEVDGNSHNSEVQKLKDENRDLILKIEFDIETYRVTNKEVEEILLKKIRRSKVVDVI